MLSSPAAVGSIGGFPLGKTGGLIEALRVQGRRFAQRLLFPLGKTGGLIEARSDLEGSLIRPGVSAG